MEQEKEDTKTIFIFSFREREAANIIVIACLYYNIYVMKDATDS